MQGMEKWSYPSAVASVTLQCSAQGDHGIEF